VFGQSLGTFARLDVARDVYCIGKSSGACATVHVCVCMWEWVARTYIYVSSWGACGGRARARVCVCVCVCGVRVRVRVRGVRARETCFSVYVFESRSLPRSVRLPVYLDSYLPTCPDRPIPACSPTAALRFAWPHSACPR
jgi:hypothetical protein